VSLRHRARKTILMLAREVCGEAVYSFF
jgi:hypothetical protein